MSIATQIQALQTDKTNIRNAIINKGGTSASGNGFDDFATDIGTIPTGITPSGSINITANGTYDVTSKASAAVNVPTHGKHWSITLSNNQTTTLTVTSGDTDISEHYNSDSAIAFYQHNTTPVSGRYRGMAYNAAGFASLYGFYLSTGGDTRATTPLSDPTTTSKAIIATSSGELKIVATATNFLQAGTLDVYFYW